MSSTKPSERKLPQRSRSGKLSGMRPHGDKTRTISGKPAGRTGVKANERPTLGAPAEMGKKQIAFRCPVASRCGGCQLSRLHYQQQLAWKQRRVEELLGQYGKVEPILGMARPFHYRNKVHAVFAVDKQGLPVSGVYAMGTHHVVPVQHCLLEDQRADAIIQTIVNMLPKYKLRIYNEYTHRGFLRHVVIRTGHVTGQIMVVLVTTSQEFPGGKAFVTELLQQHPEITTVVLNINQRETSMVLGKKDVVLYGDGFMEDELCGKRFRISPQSFYQVNARQTDVLYRTAIEMAGLTGKELLLDAYCGTGTIGLCASDHIAGLIGVELNADAVRDAKENARRNNVTNAAFYCDDAGRFMVRMAKEGQHVDVVLMDPPRAGSDEPFLRSVVTLAPEKVVYVSCNPETQARDVAYLTEHGYQVQRIVPVDMFPCTEHVETVILLSQQKPDDTIRVGIDLKPEDVTVAERKATYAELQAYIENKYGFKVSNLYIAQVKSALGIKERENYNLPKSANGKKLVCPPEKMKAIQDALRHFKMI